MSKDIKEYLKYYIGQSWQVTQLSGTFESGIYGTDIFNSLLLRELGLGNVTVKPILRKLESMTEDEAIKGGWSSLSHFNYYRQGNNGTFYPEDFHFLLSLGFDLFNLIPEGLAIDKETLKG